MPGSSAAAELPGHRGRAGQGGWPGLSGRGGWPGATAVRELAFRGSPEISPGIQVRGPLRRTRVRVLGPRRPEPGVNRGGPPRPEPDLNRFAGSCRPEPDVNRHAKWCSTEGASRHLWRVHKVALRVPATMPFRDLRPDGRCAGGAEGPVGRACSLHRGRFRRAPDAPEEGSLHARSGSHPRGSGDGSASPDTLRHAENTRNPRGHHGIRTGRDDWRRARTQAVAGGPDRPPGRSAVPPRDRGPATADRTTGHRTVAAAGGRRAGLVAGMVQTT